jgi:hypothetical protein
MRAIRYLMHIRLSTSSKSIICLPRLQEARKVGEVRERKNSPGKEHAEREQQTLDFSLQHPPNHQSTHRWLPSFDPSWWKCVREGGGRRIRGSVGSTDSTICCEVVVHTVQIYVYR